MSSYLTQLFTKIASDINRPFTDFEPFIKLLEQNWYDSEQAIKQMKDEQFDSLKIPKRIIGKIRQFTSSQQNKQQLQMKQNKKIDWEESNKQQQIIDFNKALKEQICYEDKFMTFISSLQVETTNNKSKMLQSIGFLIKIVQNIIQNPDNEKFKIIKLTSKTLTNYLLCYDSCSYILEFIGFVKTSQDIVMLQPDISHLKSCQRQLQIQLQKVQAMYDPYQASFNSSSMMPNMIYNQGKDRQEKNYGQMLDQLIAYRKQKMSHPPPNRAARIYHKKLEQRQITQFESSKDPILKQYFKKLVATNSESASFRNKRKIQFQMLIKQPVYESTTILIKLPNEYIIEGIFGPYQSIQNVIDFVKKYIDGAIYIYTTPPVVHMNKHKQKSLVQMDCVPRGVFQMGAEGPWQIKPQYVEFIES